MTTDITELAQSLKAAAVRVIKNYDSEWFEAGHQICTVHKSKINLISLANPANILALVEALEKSQSANAAQDDHINQQQDRIEQLEKRNAELGKHVGMLEKRLKGTEESLIASTDMVTELESKLANPVQLPKTNGYWTETEKAFEEAITLAKRKIRLAGFRCEGDE